MTTHIPRCPTLQATPSWASRRLRAEVHPGDMVYNFVSSTLHATLALPLPQSISAGTLESQEPGSILHARMVSRLQARIKMPPLASLRTSCRRRCTCAACCCAAWIDTLLPQTWAQRQHRMPGLRDVPRRSRCAFSCGAHRVSTGGRYVRGPRSMRAPAAHTRLLGSVIAHHLQARCARHAAGTSQRSLDSQQPGMYAQPHSQPHLRPGDVTATAWVLRATAACARPMPAVHCVPLSCYSMYWSTY
jgi:hypothetical protein